MELPRIILFTISITLSCDIIFISASDFNKSHDNLIEICQKSKYVATTSKYYTYYYYYDEQMTDEHDTSGKYCCVGKNLLENKFLCSKEDGRNCDKLYIGKVYPHGTIEYIKLDTDPKKCETVCTGILEDKYILYMNPNNFRDFSKEMFYNGNILFNLKGK